MKELTVIIPFLNEGDELGKTLRSIRAHSDGKVEIIVINDASDDGKNYEAEARKYDAVYIRNEKRMGVAASRDLGVNRCRTPYFLLLDAHMRFYDKDWVGTIVSELKQDERTLLCCQTKILTKQEDGRILEGGASGTFGAYLDFEEEHAMQLHWRAEESDRAQDVEDIPCVLGAGYACSKWYWMHLNGLNGLRFYGCDEAYISLKVWLEGGRCKLLKKVVIGHVYRSQFPYRVSNADIFYNQMLIAETLLPDRMKKAVFERLRKESNALFEGANRMFLENSEEIARLRGEYRRMTTRDFSEIMKMNSLAAGRKEDAYGRLRPYVGKLVLGCGGTGKVGLYDGKMGLALLLYYYKQRTEHSFYAELADELLDDVYGECCKLPVDFAYGICGIGWAISHSIRRGFVEGNVNEVLAAVDRKVMERDPSRVTDWSFKTGLSGVLCYVLTRLEDAKCGMSPNPFDADYLGKLQEASLRMLGDAGCREDNRMALAYVACGGKPEIAEGAFEVPDVVNWGGLEEPDGQACLFDLEKGLVGYVLKGLC